MSSMDDHGMTSTLPTHHATAVDRFLEATLAGTGMPADIYSPDAVLDATTPGWRFEVRGAEAIAGNFTKWFADPSEFEELDRYVIDGGEVVMYLQTWIEKGVPHAAHHCHVLKLDDEGRIVKDSFFCGGRWDAALLARMADESDAR